MRCSIKGSPIFCLCCSIIWKACFTQGQCCKGRSRWTACLAMFGYSWIRLLQKSFSDSSLKFCFTWESDVKSIRLSYSCATNEAGLTVTVNEFLTQALLSLVTGKYFKSRVKTPQMLHNSTINIFISCRINFGQKVTQCRKTIKVSFYRWSPKLQFS